MLNIILLMLGMLSPYPGTAEDVEPPANAGMSAPAVHASMTIAPALQEEGTESLESLNNISLADRTDDVIRKLGEPMEQLHEPLTGTMEFHYKDMIVGLSDGYTEYVHVRPWAGTIQINGQSVQLTTGELQSLLGSPDHELEDGDVYIRGEQVIKVFKDREADTITGVDLFFKYLE